MNKIRVNEYRDCIRHIWNCFMLPRYNETKDWGIVDSYVKIKNELFYSMVLSRPEGGNIIDFEFGSESYNIMVEISNSNPTPALINREIGVRYGYWDYDEKFIPPNSELLFVDFFDWDQCDFIDLALVILKIENCPSHPELNGRYAILECGYCNLQFRL
ncbi:hypothetical protein [Chitinivorax sp. B]|uniref:hypothetical protein n=1 Tax=Chitinivorax sp. B TaxID=2502235 RepID=UPI0010F74265|nr:hypothetical protein [Chitinivorax sp. B]